MRPPVQKVSNCVSKKLRNFARGQMCTMQLPGCDRSGETTVMCHIRRFTNTGMAEKPHDFFAYHGCANCHRNEDKAGDDDFLRALIITQNRLYEAGLLGPRE
ncbi:DUF1364 family protein [Roseobacter sp. HKCCD9010]|nr:nuclease domain-containing protein [Roseobacter sp. HKCCD8410]MBF9050667.1 DUF1364 family protein [Rhodobacterales bacterium HKCCD4356]NNV11915.1 DUF1364 family protein [Roseobacter sp. HKCCD7357]NNV16928.1 DUF1364 family protein [Roseobacter sp. HKCCD8768]NNV26157.1 DUF1364 family protein [Roseobacter sp. HKCCD8192]NNV30649.1 DUF1364 family protein [Roseobacter sp. HKCCD9061]NNV34915.1 DUF1364 family protein [Roseobacter sp. HKCCD9073]NNV38935.1 DUF1364 family protein [Roseobacter sp. HK